MARVAIVTALLAAQASGASAGGASSTYRDAVGDAGRAPDIAAVDVRAVDARTLAVTVTLAQPTDLGRSGWIVIGIDTDRDQMSGGMHGSEVVVLANADRVVLHRVGGPYTTLEARRTRTELEFTLDLGSLGVRSFDFAVATLRQDADVAPDRGVFSYPLGPPQRRRGGVAPARKR